MAYRFEKLPQDLGRIQFEGNEYVIVQITTFYDERQEIELRNVSNGESVVMKYNRNDAEPYFGRR